MVVKTETNFFRKVKSEKLKTKKVEKIDFFLFLTIHEFKWQYRILH